MICEEQDIRSRKCCLSVKHNLHQKFSFNLFVLSVLLLLTMPALGQSVSDVNAPQDKPEAGFHPGMLYHNPDLEEYLRIAADENPELRALWHQYQAELAQIPQAGALPNPEVTIGYTFNPMMSESVLGRFSASAMQMFPWFGTLSTRRDIQRASAESEYQRLNSRQLLLFRELQIAWLDISELQIQITIAGKILELVRDLESLVEVRYETAQTGQADLLRIQMEEQRLETMVENLEDNVRSVRARFNEFLNREPQALVETAERIEPMELHQSDDELRAQILELNPQFEELDARRRMLKEQKELARLDGRPTIGLGVEVMGGDFGAMSMFPGSGEMVMGMATIRIPLYRSRYSAQSRQATEQLHAVDSQKMQTENRLITQLEEALKQYRSTVRSATLLNEELIPRAEQAMEILRTEYAAGNTRLDELLQIQRQLLDLELEQAEILVNQHKAVINIETLIGATPPYQIENKGDTPR